MEYKCGSDVPVMPVYVHRTNTQFPGYTMSSSPFKQPHWPVEKVIFTLNMKPQSQNMQTVSLYITELHTCEDIRGSRRILHVSGSGSDAASFLEPLDDRETDRSWCRVPRLRMGLRQRGRLPVWYLLLYTYVLIVLLSTIRLLEVNNEWDTVFWLLFCYIYFHY